MDGEPSCAIGSGTMARDARRLKALEDGNAGLERPCADVMLDNAGLTDLPSRKR